MVNLILWLLFGALVGWLASKAMRANAEQSTLFTIGIGIAGAMIGGLLFNYSTPNLFNLQNAFNLTALFTSVVGAVILLGVVNLVRRGTVR
jgi:uncharacterized membrane protein YeaQ/YmgE (transglycosylase-associated protein family)